MLTSQVKQLEPEVGKGVAKRSQSRAWKPPDLGGGQARGKDLAKVKLWFPAGILAVVWGSWPWCFIFLSLFLPFSTPPSFFSSVLLASFLCFLLFFFLSSLFLVKTPSLSFLFSLFSLPLSFFSSPDFSP